MRCDPELVSAAEWLYDERELLGPVDLLRFISRPSRYPALLEMWDEERSRQGEAQDEWKYVAP